jgi:hypothetical protein
MEINRRFRGLQDVEKIHRAESGVEVGTPEGDISWNEL